MSADASPRVDPGSEPPAAISVRGLAKSFGEVEAVRGVDFEVARGRGVRLPRPERGGQVDDDQHALHARDADRGERDGRRPRRGRERDDVRRNIGLVFQDPTLDGYLSAEQNLRFTPSSTASSARLVAPRMRQVLEMVGLWERRDVAGGHLLRRDAAPAGDRARACCTRRACCSSTSRRSGSTRRRAARSGATSRELQAREDITIFMTTHYMDEAEYCDRIAIMDQGEIVVLDTPEALKASVGEDRVRIETDDDDAAIAALRERFGIEATSRRGRGHVRASRRARSSCRACSPSWACRSASVSVSRPTLDDVFMSYTGTTIRDAEERRRQAGEPDAHAGDDRSAAMSASRRRPTRGVAVRAPAEVVARPRPGAQLAQRAARDQGRLAARADPLLAATGCGSSPRWSSRCCSCSCSAPGLQQLVAARAPHGVDLKTFIYPGILCLAVMFTAMFSAASIVWDREFGFLREMMVAPVRRSSIVIGKCLGGATVASFQGVILIALAGLVDVPYTPALIARRLRAAAAARVQRSPRSA